MKRIISAIGIILFFYINSCKAFEDGMATDNDYVGSYPDYYYYLPPYYNNYNIHNPWGPPIFRPHHPVVPNIPQRPTRPPAVANPSSPQAPSYNGQRPGSNSSNAKPPLVINRPASSPNHNLNNNSGSRINGD